MRSTGASIIDHVLGGFPPGLPLILAGPSGSGRTVIGLQLAQGALERGEIVQFVSSEPAQSLIHQAGALGFDFEPALANERLVLLELDATTPSLVRAQGVESLVAALQGEAPDAALVIVDPFTAITAEIADEPRLREVSRAFTRALGAAKLVLTVESERLAQQRGLERVLSELCGAYLLLEREPSGRRTLSVEKSRSGLGAAERVEFAIGPGGTHLVGEATPKAAIPLFTRVRRATPQRRAPSDPPIELAMPVEPIRAPESRRRERPARRAPNPPAASEDDAPRQSERRLILLVEDNRLQRELLTDWLSPRYEVLTAADGFEALAKIVSHDPDLVILDLIMPRVTGYELLCALRRVRVDMPVLVTSSRINSTGERLGPLVLGATDFMSKPLNRIELEHKVETLLRLRREHDRRFDGSEAEELFGRFGNSRRLEEPEFCERVSRAVRFGDRHGLLSTLVRLRAPDKGRLDAWIQTADEDLRFEDAILRRSKSEALVLLVATGCADAPKVIERTSARCEERVGRAPDLEVELLAAAEWLEIEGLELGPES